MIGGSITVAQDVLNYRGKRRESGRHVVGRAVGRFDRYAGIQAFVASYKKNFRMAIRVLVCLP